MHSTARITSRRTMVISERRSNRPSGRATSPIVPRSSSRTVRSGRLGGESRSACSDMTDLRGKMRLDPVGKQHAVHPFVDHLEGGGSHLGETEVLHVHLRLYASRMRGHQQD